MEGRWTELWERLPDYLSGHLLLALPAILCGVFLSVPLGILSARNPRVRGPLMTVASLAQTIPSIALLAIMVAILGGTIGYRPAFVALLIYSMLPILRNTLTGLEEVDPAMREAARGVGMTGLQSLWRIELPLALPVILTGVRTATVWVVGITTLSTPVGAPSLGNFIFSGLQLRDWAQVYFGCLFAMALTLVLDQAVHGFEVAARRRRWWPAMAGGGVLLSTLMAAFLPGAIGPSQRVSDLASKEAVAGEEGGNRPQRAPLEGRSYTVGAKGFTEQAILGELLSLMLEAQGASTEIKGNMGSTIVFDALRNDTLDVYIDYSGTIWATVMGRDDPAGRHAMAIEVAHYLRQEHGILTLGRLGFENAYCLALRNDDARRLGLRTIADLSQVAEGLTLGGSPEFLGRPEWTRVRSLYDLQGMRTRGMEGTFMYRAARDGQVDVIGAYSTDGRIEAFDLRVLQDTRQGFPPYDAILMVAPGKSGDLALHRALAPLVQAIDGVTMRRANLLVDVEGKTPAEAARFLLRVVAGREPGAP